MSEESIYEGVPSGPRARSAAPVRRAGARRAGAGRGRPLGPFDVGSALARSFRAFVRHFGVLFPLSILFAVPTTLYEVGQLGPAWDRYEEYAASLAEFRTSFGDRPRPPFWAFLVEEGSWLGVLLPLLSMLLVQTVVTYVTFQALRGGRVDYLRAIGAGFAELPSAVLASIATLVVILVPGVGFAFLGVGTGRFGGYLALLGIVVWAVVVYVSWYVAIQAVVVERIAAFAALGRSLQLTRWFRWKVFAIVVVPGVLYMILPLVRRGGFPHPASLESARTILLATHAAQAVLSAFSAVVAAVVYHDLRRAKEGVGVEDLLKVFA